MASSRALSHGFWMKSRAPRRMASTASSMLPQAVIRTTGSVLSMARIRVQQIQAFLAGGGVAGVVEVDEDDVEVAGLQRRDDACRRRRRLDPESLGLQQQPQRFEDVRLVVGDQNARRGRFHESHCM